MAEKFRKSSKNFPDTISYYFDDMSALKPDLGHFRPFLGHFRRFEGTYFRAQSKWERPKKSTFFASSHYLGPQTKFLSQNICALLLKTQFHRANRFFEILHLQWIEVRTHRVKLHFHSNKSALDFFCLQLVTNMPGYGYLYQKIKINEGFCPSWKISQKLG